MATLTAIPGVGESTVAALVNAGYQNVESVKSADDEGLLSVPGVGDLTVRRIREHFGQPVSDAIVPFSMPDLDDHGQPKNRRLNSLRRADRGVAEMLGLVRGVIADGVANEKEAVAVHHWVDANPDIAAEWPASVVARRLNQIFEDGRVDAEERASLAKLLERVVGGKPAAVTGAQLATRLPLDEPPPMITLPDNVFVFTGEFAFGTRRVCEDAARMQGARPERRVTMRTDYLVIGTVASRDWIESAYGRKIERAIDYRDNRGLDLAIVSEDRWAESVWS